MTIHLPTKYVVQFYDDKSLCTVQRFSLIIIQKENIWKEFIMFIYLSLGLIENLTEQKIFKTFNRFNL